jgi:hypothetical protein
VDLLVYDDEDQRYVPMLVAICGAVIGAMIIGGLGYYFGQARPVRSADPIVAVTEPAAARQSSECAAAIERADGALTVATRLEGALREQTSVMDDLLAERVSREQALDRSLPPLTNAAKDRQAFLQAVATYERSRAACP